MTPILYWYSSRNLPVENNVQVTREENCALLGYYAASSGNSLPIFGDKLSVPSSRVEDGTDRFSCKGILESSIICRYFACRTDRHTDSEQHFQRLPETRRLITNTNLF
jgi:hypothetical protein